MKILIISESNEKLDAYSDFFMRHDFNTITYSWLLKALDNIIEIKPNAVIINAIDYPRHWKTLVQYIRAVYEGVSPIILIAPNDLDEDEQKKVEALEVFCVQEDFLTSEEGTQVLALLESSPANISDEDFQVLDFIEDTDRQKHVFLDQSVEDYVNEFNAMLQAQAGNAAAESDNTEPENASTENNSESIILQEDNIETVNTIETTNAEADKEETQIAETPTEVESAFIEDIQATNEVTEDFIKEQNQEANQQEVTNDEDLYFDEDSINEDIFEDEEPINTEYGTWLSCPNAETGENIFGEVTHYEHPIIHFKPTDASKLALFSFGKKIESCTLTDDGYPSTITVQVQGLEDSSIELCVVR